MIRTICILFWGVIAVFCAIDSGLSSSQIFLIISGIILYEILKPSSSFPEKRKTVHKKKYELTPFNDAVANELMRIRSDLVHIKVKQCNEKWPNICDNFVHMYWLYMQYPSAFLCTSYNISKDIVGLIVIVLNHSAMVDDFWQIKFHAEELREINSNKPYKIASGDSISVYICESKQDNYCTSERRAKVLSIQEDGYLLGTGYVLTLEINLYTVEDELRWEDWGNRDSHRDFLEKNKITRQINVLQPNFSTSFVPDKKEVEW